MTCLHVMWQSGKIVLLALLGWFTIPGVALAQRMAAPVQKAAEQQGSNLYVACYAFVILCIGLGMLLLCRGSNRRDRARPEDYVESAVVQETKEAQKK
jgi:hypothetical protein